MQISLEGWIGIILGVGSIAIGLFLYSYDLRKKIDRMIGEETKTLSQFDSHLSSQHYETLTSIKSTLIAYRDEVMRRLTEIHEKQEGILSKIQAVQLTDLYLDSVAAHLANELTKLDHTMLKKNYDLGNNEIIHETLRNQYNLIVHHQIRPMLRPFLLRGHQTFEAFVSEVNSDEVNKVFLRIKRLLIGDPRVDYASFMSKIYEMMGDTRIIGKQRMIEKIDILYPEGTHASKSGA